MKSKVLLFILAVTLFSFPKLIFSQTPNLGTAANFVLFSTVGAVSNTGISQLTGSVGTNSGSSTGFGNVNGVMQDNNGASAQAAADLMIAYNQLNSTIPTFFPAPLLGNGQILNAGVYSISGPTTLNLGLTLDAQGDPGAVFIFQIQGAFSTAAASKVHLINGAQACNVFWKVEGLVSMAAGATMRGTIIANNAAINMSTGDTLEGRALSTAGAITVSGVLAYTPVGCGSPNLSGPIAPALVSTACFAIFSSDGPVSNVGITHVTGDIGSNNGLVTGYNPLFVTGAIHTIPDGATVAVASDLLNVYNYLNTLPYDIELLYPVQFGNNLVLTPHTYLMNAAVTFTDTLYLNAMGNADAVFVIQINGALTTSVYSKVNLINGTQAKNVFWKVDGAVSINDYSVFRGTIIANNGAINLNTGVTLDGRALTTTGAVSTSAINVIMPPGCATITAPLITSEPESQTACIGDSATFSVIASGDGLTYQWRKGNINLTNSGNISGANSATLVIDPISLTDAALNYNVIVSGDLTPADTSLNVALIVDSPPTIFTQPQDQVSALGGTVSYTVSALGTNLTYQWRKGNVNLANVGNINGAFTSTLTINPVGLTDVATDYNVIVTGVCGPVVTSANVALIISNSPIIIAQASNQSACVGTSVTFTVTASGDGLTYQWRKGSINLTNGLTISGATTASLTINPVAISDAASNYNVVVTGTYPPAVTSNDVTLFVETAPVIVTQPVDQIAGAGNSVSFTVAATGTALTYQWRKGLVNLTNIGNVSGANSATLTVNPVSLADAATDYNVVVTGSCSPNATSNNVSLVISNSPNIVTAIVNQSACVGTSVTFSVIATGDGLTYQWRKGSVNLINGTNLSGVTSSTLTINPVGISDAASNYNVVVTGTYPPAVTSNDVTLFVETAPVIVTQPVDQITGAGNSVSFTVAATGTALTYQWRKGLINLVDGGNISGATTATLTLNPVTVTDAAADYNVVITGTCAPAVTSALLTLVVNTAPIIVTGPTTQTVCAGSSVSFSVVATGAGLTYQWRRGAFNLVNSGSISGATSAVLTINPVSITDAALNYNVVVSGTYLPAATSTNASLFVNSAPVILTQPINQVSTAGGSVSYTVIASGTGLTYQWRIGTINLVNTGNISGANTATLTINPANISDAVSDYNVVVSGSCSPNATSNNVSLVISNSPNIVTAIVNQSACVGTSVTFSVIATGDGLTYQWRKGSVNLINGTNLSGVTSSTLTINPVGISDAASNYNVVVTGTYPPAVTSNDVTLFVETAPVIVTQPVNQIAGAGNSVSFTVAATGTALTYQWRKGLINLVDGGNISGATTATLTLDPLNVGDAAANYNVVVSGTCAPAVTSAFVALVVNTAPIIVTGPTTQTVCAGSSVSFSVVATGAGLTYQWRRGAFNLVNSGSISGATSAVLTINPVNITDAALNYNVVVSGTYLPVATSTNASLFVNSAPVILTQPINQVSTAGGSVSYTVIASGTGLTYQWRIGTINLVNTGNISGANTATLTINPANISDAVSDYNVVVSGSCSPNATANNVSLVISNSPNIVTAIVNQSACVGTSVTFSVIANGDGLTYQWRKGIVNLSNGGNISGVNTATLTINPVGITDAASNYNVVVTGTYPPAVTSNDVTLFVETAPVIVTQPVNQVAGAGNSVSFSVAATGTALTHQWRKGLINLVDGGNISGATSATLTLNPVNLTDAAANYNVVITGTCSPAVTSAMLTLDVNTSPVIVTAPTNQTVCAGSSVSFTVVATGAGLTYQWRKGTTNLVDGGNISGATSATLTINPVSLADAAANYNVVVSGTFSPAVTTANVSLNVNTAPVILTQAVSVAMCNDGGAVSFSVLASGTNLSYQWRRGSTNLTNGSNISGATTAILTINPVNLTDASSDYYVIVTGDCAPALNSLAVALLVYPDPIAIAASNSPVTAGASINLTAQTVAGGTYQWSGPNGFTSTLQNPVITEASAGDGGVYTLVVTSNTCPSASDQITVVITEFKIPEGFSPNGDGTNDLFVIRGIDSYPDNSITIFNRWGDKVFEATPYLNNWDGKCVIGLRFGGDELPVGTYFYVLDLGNGSGVFKGTIFLNK